MASADRIDEAGGNAGVAPHVAAGEAADAAPGRWPAARGSTRSLDGGAGRGPVGPAGTGPTGPAGRRPGTATRTPGPRRLGSAGTDDALRELVGGFARAFLEVEAGRRPRRQLAPVMSVELATRLAPVWVREDHAPGLVVRVCGARMARDRYEAVAVVARGERYGALAMSLARRRGRWLVVEAVRPEMDAAPPAASG